MIKANCNTYRVAKLCSVLNVSRSSYYAWDKRPESNRSNEGWLYDNRTIPAKEMIKSLNLKLVGHYRYYCVSFNGKMITNFLHRVQQFLCKTLNRRSDMKSYNWDGYIEMLKYYLLAKPKIYFKLL